MLSLAFPPFHVCFHSRKLCQAQSSPESHGGAMPLPFTSVWGSQDGARSVQQFQIQPWFLQTHVTPSYVCSDSSNVWNIWNAGPREDFLGLPRPLQLISLRRKLQIAWLSFSELLSFHFTTRMQECTWTLQVHSPWCSQRFTHRHWDVEKKANGMFPTFVVRNVVAA